MDNRPRDEALYTSTQESMLMGETPGFEALLIAARESEGLRKDVQYIKESMQRLEQVVNVLSGAVGGINSTIQTIVDRAISDNNKRNEAIVQSLIQDVKLQLTATEKLGQSTATKMENISTTVIGWKGGLALLTGASILIPFAIWLLNKAFPIMRP